MVKTVISDNKGLVQHSGQTGFQVTDAVYTNQSTAIRATAAPAAALGEALIQLVDSTDSLHTVKVPLARGPGQIIIVCNVDSAESAVIRNNADDGNLAVATAGASVFLRSSAAGDNWTAHLSI